jgi:predicted MFS family arabinose efflux permease
VSSDAPSASSRPARTISASIFATAAGALPVFLLGGVAVQVRGDLGFGEGRLGLSVTLFFALSSALSATAGRITQRMGIHRAMTMTSVVSAAGLLIMASSPAWTVLAVGLVVGALANAFAQPAANLLLAQGIDRRKQGLAFGLKQGAVPLTSLLGGLAVPVFALTIGWRWAFVAGAVCAGLLLTLIPPDLRSAPRPAKGAALPKLIPGTRRPLLVLSGAAALGNMGANSLGVFLVESLVAAGTAEARAGFMLMGGSFLGMSMRVGMGWWADRTPRQLFRTAALMLGIGAVGYALLATGSRDLMPIGILLTFGAGWGWNGLFAYSVVASNRMAPATATGITQRGLFFGAMAGPGLFGIIAENFGFSAAWATVAVLVLLGSIAMYSGSRMMAAHSLEQRDLEREQERDEEREQERDEEHGA